MKVDKQIVTEFFNFRLTMTSNDEVAHSAACDSNEDFEAAIDDALQVMKVNFRHVEELYKERFKAIGK